MFRREEQKNGQQKNVQEQKRGVGMIITAIFLTSINIVFLLFVIVQLKYFFGGEVNIGVEGWTYAQYARNGFAELVMVGVISFWDLSRTAI